MNIEFIKKIMRDNVWDRYDDGDDRKKAWLEINKKPRGRPKAVKDE